MKTEVSARIRKLRVDSGLSQENVADELGMTSSAYSKIERGETDPNSTKLKKIADLLKVSVADLFEDDPKTNFTEPTPAYTLRDSIDQLHALLPQLMNEIAALRKDLEEIKKGK